MKRNIRTALSWIESELTNAGFTPELLALFRTPLVLSRSFTTADGKPCAEPVILLGNGICKNRYAGDASVVGTLRAALEKERCIIH